MDITSYFKLCSVFVRLAPDIRPFLVSGYPAGIRYPAGYPVSFAGYLTCRIPDIRPDIQLEKLYWQVKSKTDKITI